MVKGLISAQDAVKEYSERTDKTVHFARMKLVGDQKEYEITEETFNNIKKARSSGFTGLISIKELDMVLPMSQIARIQADERIESDYKDFSRLPTRSIELNIDFTPKQRPASLSVPENGSYYLAVVHYVTKNNDFEYILDKDKIKKLTLVEVIDGEEFCSEIYEYGRKVYPNYSEDY